MVSVPKFLICTTSTLCKQGSRRPYLATPLVINARDIPTLPIPGTEDIGLPAITLESNGMEQWEVWHPG